ncbi:MAG TPA: site-specific integrase [Solirubrobacterales bacterium]|nr:site-specific integrase [Solirubrobacterales bacterium]
MQRKGGSAKRPYGTGSIFEHNGSVTFRFRPSPGKPQVQRKVCRIGELGKRAIEAKCRQIEAEYSLPQETPAVPTIAEVGCMHIRQLELDGKAKSYTRNRWRTLRNYVNPEFGERSVDAPKPKDINRFKRKMQQAGKGPSTIRSVLWLLSGIFKYAVVEEWRTDNPVAAVEMPEYKNTHPVVYMTPAEVNRVITAVPDDEWGKVERVLYRAGQKSGLRRSELLAVKWSDCDFILDVIRVERAWVEGEFKAPKGKRSRTVPMVPDFKRELENWRKRTRYPAEHHLVFGDPITGRPLEPSKVTKRFNKALLNAGVGPTEIRNYKNSGKVYKRPHPLYEFRDLRDTFGSYLMMHPKISPREVQEWMGHASLTTTSQRYSQFIPSLDAAERMAGAFEDRSSIGTQSPQHAPDDSERVGTAQK